MLSRRRLRCYQSEMDLSSSAAALLAGDIPVQVRHFPLRGGEELLELVLEGQIAGGGGVRCLNGGPPGSRRGTGGCCRTGLEVPLGGALRRASSSISRCERPFGWRMAGWRGFVSGANFSVRRVCWLRRGRCVPPEMLLMSFLQNGFQPLHSGCCGGLGVIYTISK